MTRALIKKQLMELFQTYFVDQKTGKARTPKRIVLSFVLFGGLFLILMSVFFSLATGLGDATLNNGNNWLYFALMGLLSIVLGLFGSVLSTYASVYLPKDNETLLSLPIPPKTLLISRVSGVFLMSLLFSAWVWIPACVVYWLAVPVTFTGILFPVLLTFAVALFVTVLSCLLGFFVAAIASKTKGKSIVTVLFSIIGIGLYYSIYFKIMQSLSDIIAHMDDIGLIVKKLGYIYWLGKAADGDILCMLLTVSVTALMAIACLWLLSKTLLRLLFTKDSSSAGKHTRAAKIADLRTMRKALGMRELKHFTSVSVWMLNGGLGLLILAVGAVFLLIKSAQVTEIANMLSTEAPRVAALLPLIVALAPCFILSMDAITAASVSMEGKTLWQIQSLPVKPEEILYAKARMAFQLSAGPILFFSVSAGIVFRFDAVTILLTVLTTLAFMLFIAYFGLFLNVHNPNLRWTNPAVPCKQDIHILFFILGGWGTCALLGGTGYLLCNVTGFYPVLVLFTVVLTGVACLLRRWMKTKGSRIIATL